jgi:hypothetical protein
LRFDNPTRNRDARMLTWLVKPTRHPPNWSPGAGGHHEHRVVEQPDESVECLAARLVGHR